MNIEDFDTNLFGKRVSVTWLDTQGFINNDLADVILAECKSEGVLLGFDSEKLVLRTALYTGTSTGDYTAIAVGCVVEVSLI
jgi:hypothetical protein